MNVYRDLCNDIKYILLNGGSSLETLNHSLKYWADSTENLTDLWQNNEDPNSSFYNEVMKLDGITNPDDGYPIIKEIISNCFGGTDNINKWSSKLINLLLVQLEQFYDKDKDGGTMATINNEAGLITAQSNLETSIPTSQEKTVGNNAQAFLSTQQPQADIGNSVISQLTAFAGLLSMIVA